MAACGLIMGGSALAYTVATLIRWDDEDGADDDDNDEDEDDIVVVVVVVVVVVEYDHHNILQEAQGDKSRELRRDFLKSHQTNLSSFCDLSTLIFHCRKSYLIKFSNISF